MEPDIQKLTLLFVNVPNEPVTKVQPLVGLIDQPNLPVVQAVVPVVGTTRPVVPTLLNVMLLATQTESFGV